MGSISRHSIQVTAKNSTKIRSFCFGTDLGLAMAVTAGGSGVRVARLTGCSVVTAKSVSGALQENKIKEIVKANR